FIDALSEEYDEKSHKSLIKYCDVIGIKGTDGIDTEALNNDLVEEAKKLDDRTSELRKASKEEISNIARIIIAILNITEYDSCACKEAIKTVEE
ncbi:1439_t:CDS:2, partial [Gigaspora rosea]